MLSVLKDLRQAIDEQRRAAYCRLVETRGSTPQKAGATMLVFEDGQQAGTLGGGCVEAEVKRNALRVLRSQQAEVTTFQLDHDYGWDDGLICGGRMTVLIEPLIDAHTNYFERLLSQAATGQGFTEVVVFDAEKSGLPMPASFLLDEHDQPLDALHVDRSAANAILSWVRPLADRPCPYTTAGVAFLPLAGRCRLLIVGGGHIGQAVASLAHELDFEVWVTDDRESYVSQARFPHAERRLAGPCEQILSQLQISPDTYCLIVTRGHNHDKEALYRLVNRGARYVGMIGSKRKIKLIFEDLLDEGISAESLDEVFAPVGIDIGSQTVSEIAISIAAELVSHRNCSGRVPGRPDRISIDL